MNSILSNLKIQVNENLYLKDPESSELGRKIIRQSILLIDEIGLEHFTFKKLGECIGSNESSLYRYFENKHKLMIYLSSIYWGWIEYNLVLATANISDSFEKLKVAITIITQKVADDKSTVQINKAILSKIIIAEFLKTMHTKELDDDNKKGFYVVYKRVINRIVTLVNQVNPNYFYAKTLVSSIVEGSLHQHFLQNHLKTITSCNETTSVTDFYIDCIEHILQKK